MQILDQICSDVLASLLPLEDSLPNGSTVLYKTLQHLVAEAANLPVLSASNYQATCELSQQDAMLPEMPHVHMAASQNYIREDQDAHKLATMMWTMLCVFHPTDFHLFMQLVQRLSFQSLAGEIVDTLCKQVRHSYVRVTGN